MSKRIVRTLLTLAVVSIYFTAGARAQVDPNIEGGMKPYGSYHGGDIDSISLSTGHLTVRAPFYSLPQRAGKLKLSFSILYDNVYGTSVQTTCAPPPSHVCTYRVVWKGSSAGIAFDDSYFISKRLINSGQTDQNGNPAMIPVFSVITTDGASHQLAYVGGNTYETLDATGFRFDATNNDFTNPAGTLTDANGIRHSPMSSALVTWPVASPPALSEDQNGNQISYNGSAFTDTLGRSVTVVTTAGNLSSCPQVNFPYQPTTSAGIWNLPAPNGGQMTVTLCSASVYIRTSLCGPLPQCTEYSGNQTMLQSIVLPNGSYWAFEYAGANPNDSTSIGYDDLLKVILPTGGSVSYTLAPQPNECTISSGTIVARNAIATRTLDAADGTGPHTWNYTWGNPVDTGTSYTNINSVVDPLGQKTVHTFTGLGYSCSLYETQTQSYDSSNNLLKTVNRDYSFGTDQYVSDLAAPLRSSVVPIRTTTSWPNGKVTKTETDYDAGFAYHDPTYYFVLVPHTCDTCAIVYGTPYSATYGKPIAVREYDYGTNAPGPLLRQTKTSYLWQTNSNYLTFNEIDLTSNVSVYDPGNVLKASTNYGYDETTPASSGVTTQHDGAPVNSPYHGNQTSVSRWKSGSTVSTTNCPVAVTNGNLVSHTIFYDTGMPQQAADPCGHATNFTYSSSFAGAYATQIQFPDTNSPGLAHHSVSKNYDFNGGLILSETDQNSQVTLYTYDNMFRLKSATFPDGGLVSYTYNDSALPVSLTKTTKVTSLVSAISKSVLDGLGRVSQTQLLSDSQGIVYVDIAYDALGRKSTVSNPYRTTTDPTYGITTYNYDALGRPTKVIPPDASATANYVLTEYCGNVTKVTDQAGKWRRSVLDGLGRVIEVDEPNSSAASVNVCPGTGEPIAVTTYTYDTLGNLTQVVQSGSRQRSFVYDSLSQLTSSNNPEAGVVAYSYDADGNVIGKTDVRSITITSKYDSLHRQVQRTYSNADPTVTYNYDEANCLGQPACYNIGRRTSMTDAAGSEAWSLDKMGREIAEQRTTSGVTKTSNYTYNLDGSLATLTYPSGRTVTYTPDSARRPSLVQDLANSINYVTGSCPNGNGGSGACYAPQGALTSLVLGQGAIFAGITVSAAFNNRLQPTTIQASSGAGTALSLTYGFVDGGGHNNGNVISIANNRDTTRSQNFTYDQLNRIATAQTSSTTGPNCWGEQFGYDIWANLLSASPTLSGCPVNALSLGVNTNNWVTNTGFSYDLAGNMTSDGLNTYVFDAESQIKSAAGVTYTYDGDGNRVQKSNGKLYWYGAGSQILDESDLAGNITDEYVFFGGRRIVHRVVSTGAIYYYAEDFLGSSRVITTATGTVCYDADFYPFGGERVITNTCPQNYKFEGKERDTETGNDDFGARYYSSSLGRWISPDWSAIPAPVPYANLPNPQTLNLYALVQDNPETFADLDGHDAIKMMSGTPPAQCAISWCPTDLIMWGERGTAGGGFGPPAPPDPIPPQNPPQAQNQMSLSPQGLDFIKQHEGYSDKVYKDSAGNPTIGYGHLIKEGENFDKGITKEQATVLLAQDVKGAANAVNDKLTVKVSQTKFDALVDFAYNLGAKNLGKSTLLANINAGKDVKKENFTDWNRAGGKVVRGLTIRRTNEYNLFSKGEYGSP